MYHKEKSAVIKRYVMQSDTFNDWFFSKLLFWYNPLKKYKKKKIAIFTNVQHWRTMI